MLFRSSKDMPSAGTDRNTSADELEKQIVEVKAELDKNGCTY